MTPTKSYPYAVVNVFTTEPLSGNSLAVFPDASKFDTETMQKIARELNLTETAFVFPATRPDWRLACAYLRQRRKRPSRDIPPLARPLRCSKEESYRAAATSSCSKKRLARYRSELRQVRRR